MIMPIIIWLAAIWFIAIAVTLSSVYEYDEVFSDSTYDTDLPTTKRYLEALTAEIYWGHALIFTIPPVIAILVIIRGIL